MATLIDIVSAVALIAGGFFYLVGALGLHRMPDLFTRMHAVSVSDTLGVGLLIFGMILQAGFTLVAAKLVIILLIIWATGPVAGHALARAALHDGAKPLIADPGGQLTARSCVELFPELGVRLATPYASETLDTEDDQAAPTLLESSEPEGYGLGSSEVNPDGRVPEYRSREDGS